MNTFLYILNITILNYYFILLHVSNIDAANHIIGNRVVNGTKTNYRVKLNTIKLYLLSRPDSNELIDNNNIMSPLSTEVVQSLFGFLSINTDLPKNQRLS